MYLKMKKVTGNINKHSPGNNLMYLKICSCHQTLRFALSFHFTAINCYKEHLLTFEVLYLNIFILYYSLHLLYYISDVNILFTPLKMSSN